MGAKFILRFDDIHPQMNWIVWQQIENILIDFKIKPIIAVIPNNQDETLIKDISRSNSSKFWRLIKYYQNELGWSIAMHGYQHKYLTKQSGEFIRINNFSEFAGLPKSIQKDKIFKGKEIFINKGITPKIFIAPAHTFDKITVEVLLEQGFEIICDGYFFYPRKRLELIWIPQQLSWFKKIPFGLFTICFHHNNWQEKDLKKFEHDLKLFKQDIVSLEEALQIFSVKNFTLIDKIVEELINFIKNFLRDFGISKYNF